MVALTALVACADDKTSPKPGDVVLETHFASPVERQAWPQADFAKWVTAQGGTTSLCITVPQESSAASHMVGVPLDLARFRGCRLQFECLAKADNVSKPSASYLGVKFMLHYNVHIYAGEFSAVRWAPGADNYLRDCINLFEEYGWDWTYHAYREWDGWSVEHGSDPQNHLPTSEPNTRKTILLNWFEQNQRPTRTTKP